MTVLLVDDDEDLLELLALHFQRGALGHLTARSMDEVKALEARVPELTCAILDVNLGPGQPSGVEIAGWLRERNPNVRIVMFTGHAPDHPLVAAASAYRVIAKPVRMKTLVAIAKGEE